MPGGRPDQLRQTLLRQSSSNLHQRSPFIDFRLGLASVIGFPNRQRPADGTIGVSLRGIRYRPFVIYGLHVLREVATRLAVCLGLSPLSLKKNNFQLFFSNSRPENLASLVIF